MPHPPTCCCNIHLQFGKDLQSTRILLRGSAIISACSSFRHLDRRWRIITHYSTTIARNLAQRERERLPSQWQWGPLWNSECWMWRCFYTICDFQQLDDWFLALALTAARKCFANCLATLVWSLLLLLLLKARLSLIVASAIYKRSPSWGQSKLIWPPVAVRSLCHISAQDLPVTFLPLGTLPNF